MTWWVWVVLVWFLSYVIVSFAQRKSNPYAFPEVWERLIWLVFGPLVLLIWTWTTLEDWVFERLEE